MISYPSMRDELMKIAASSPEALQLLLTKAAAQVPGDTPPDVMKGDYYMVAYIDRRGVMPHEPDPNFPDWTYNPAEGPTCRQCHMFYYDRNGKGQCTNVLGYIMAMGSCDIYAAGPTLTPEEGKKMSNPTKLPKSLVKYVYNTTGEGYGCQRCRVFVARNKARIEGAGRCKVLKPNVEGYGCCILFSNPTTKYLVEADIPALIEPTEGAS